MRKLIFILLFVWLVACTNTVKTNTGEGVQLLLSIQLERDIYEQSNYGEPPQFAIWLEDKETGDVRTVFVTRRTATGDFEGKVECPVSLPVWIGAFRKETGRTDFPTPRNPAPDAITGATPKIKEFQVQVRIPKGSNWYYYVEENVSGDYTPEFPSVRSDGMIDSQGNGQPSIVYRGEISGVSGDHSSPELIGRTEQLYFSTEINKDLEGIKNAKEVFSMVKVKCTE